MAGKKKGTAVPKDETKAQRFSRLAAARVSTAIKKINLIAACSKRSSHEYTKEQVEQITTALEAACKYVVATYAAALKGTPEAKGETFTFKP